MVSLPPAVHVHGDRPFQLPMMVVGGSLGSVNYRGHCQHNVFVGWKTVSLDLGHHFQSLILLPDAPQHQGLAICPG